MFICWSVRNINAKNIRLHQERQEEASRLPRLRGFIHASATSKDTGRKHFCGVFVSYLLTVLQILEMHCPGVLILRVFRRDCDYFFLNPLFFGGGAGRKEKMQALSFIRIKKKQVPREERRDEKEKFD